MASETAKKDNNNRKASLGITAIGEETMGFRLDDITKRSKTDAIAEIQGYTAVGNGIKAVTTAGTRVQLSATSVPCKRVRITALESNTGVVVVGGSTVVAALATRAGAPLFPTQFEWFNVSNLNLLYLDSMVNLEGVSFYYEN